MRILLVSNLGYESATAQSVLDGLGRSYRSRGHRVAAVALHAWSPRRRFHASGREILARRHSWGPLSCVDPAARAGWAAHNERLRLILLKAAGSCDAVHVHHFSGLFDQRLAAVWLACEKLGVPRGVTIHDYGNPSWPTSSARRLKLLEAFLAGSAWTSTVSRFCADRIEADLPSLAGRVAVVPSGFEPPVAERVEASEPDAAPYALCAARLAGYKGIDTLLRAWKLVLRRESALELLVCGAEHGTAGRSLRTLASRLGLGPRVRFLGELERPRLWERLRRCRFVVLPSVHEAFGMALVEAMSCGKAVLATRSGGPQEIVRHGVNGLLVAAGDERELARGAARLCADAGLRQRLGRAGARAAMAYHWSAVARRYLTLLESPAGRR